MAVRPERAPGEQHEELALQLSAHSLILENPLTSLSLTFPICKLETTITTGPEEPLSATAYGKDCPEPQIPF